VLIPSDCNNQLGQFHTVLFGEQHKQLGSLGWHLNPALAVNITEFGKLPRLDNFLLSPMEVSQPLT
jgi:hypothetical protein